MLLHERSIYHVPEYGEWVCDCQECFKAVVRSTFHGTNYILKCASGRECVSAAVLADYMAAQDLDAHALRTGLGRIREVFVALPGTLPGRLPARLKAEKGL